MTEILAVNGAPVALVPTITVIQRGAEVKLEANVPAEHTIQLLLTALFSVHQQLVLAQAGKQPLVIPAMPGDMGLMRH